MTLATIAPWTKLLGHRFTDVHDEYGPNSHAVVCAFEAIDETRWLERVGEPWLEGSGEHLHRVDIAIVHSWDDALAIFRDRSAERYNANGILQAACDRIDPMFPKPSEREAWWQRAREDAKRYSALMSWIPRSLEQRDQDLLFENLYEYVSMLLAEIIASPDVDCTYFREQLPWFRAGHFPCGWDGAWPQGRMRIF